MDGPISNIQSNAAIGARLLATRLALTDKNQCDFALGAGIAKNTYNQWEVGKGRPGLDMALRLCGAYPITLDWIYLGDMSGLTWPVAEKLRKQLQIAS